ncbi:MAG: AAA family ATPase [Planctomyces sp.]
MRLDAEDIKRKAAGRWPDILRTVCNLDDSHLNSRNHGPCPVCGGTDRFRALDDVAETGALFCNQCHNGDTVPRSGDGIAAVQWLMNLRFPDALRKIADALGQHQFSQTQPKTPQKAKKIHATADAAADAIAYGMVKDGTLSEKRRPDAGWRYRNADGSDAGAVFRWNLPGQMKEIRQASVVAGGWITSAMPEPRPLYRLPDIIEADEVWICEGEKAADAAVSLGVQATTSAGGSNAAEKSDWRPLNGKRVYILPDNDSAGDGFAGRVVSLIRQQAPNATVEIKLLQSDWPDIPDGGDVYDWQEHFDSADAETLRARLQALPDRIAEYNIPEIKAETEEQSATEAPRIDFEIMDSRAFAEADFRVTWVIQEVMAESQPQLYSGPSKTLKTSILVDQCLSLAAAEPFLGRFEVPKQRRVLLLSSESGTATLQETARRICRTKGIDLAELGDQLHWGFRPPQLTDAQHIATLTNFILKNRIDVVGIDPAYLSMNLQGNEAANQFAVGAVLMSLTTLQAETGCTPILASHMRMHMLPGIMPTLDHIAGAGFGQWARQWVLLNRREEFNPDEPGTHRLLFTFGGSAGHCGAYGLDIEEGRAADGRFWKVDLNSLSQIREDRETEKEERKREQEQRIYENRRAAVLRAMKRFPDGETMTVIRRTASLNPENFQPVWNDLLTAMEVEPVRFNRGETRKDGTPKLTDGFRLVSLESRLKNRGTHENTQEHFEPVFSV